jgi:glyoxylase-like metal-dependent hydrolase (beta-lactamase superfamily II)
MNTELPITSEIFQVGGNSLSASEDAAVYLIAINDCVALIDIGCGHSLDRIIDNIKSCGINPSRIDYLLLTHCHFDHSGGAAEFRARTGCKIVAHELDAIYLEKGDSNVTAA